MAYLDDLEKAMDEVDHDLDTLLASGEPDSVRYREARYKYMEARRKYQEALRVERKKEFGYELDREK